MAFLSSNEPASNRIRALRLRNTALSCIVTVVTFGYELALPLGADSDDDWTMSLLLGGMGTDAGPTLFINALLSNVASLLYSAFPNGWNHFLILEIVISALAFFTIVFCSLEYVSLYWAAVLAALLAILGVPYCTYSLNFTVVACMATAAGMTVLFSQLATRRATPVGSAIGILFMCYGFMTRIESFALSLPFALILALVYIAQARHSDFPSLTSFIPLALVAIACVGLYAYDALVWSDDALHEWRQYNQVRAQISDFPKKPYEEVGDELGTIGVSRNDYWMICNWSTADEDVFSLDVLERVSNVASIRPDASFAGLASNALSYISSFPAKGIGVIAAALVLLACCIALARVKPKRLWILLLLAFSALAIISYFSALGRLLPRVENSVIIYLAVAAEVLCITTEGEIPRSGNAESVSRANRLFSATCTISALCLIVAFLAPYAHSLVTKPSTYLFGNLKNESKSAFIAYERDHPEYVYAMDVNSYKPYEQLYYRKGLPSLDVTEMTYRLGGWQTASPSVKALFKSRIEAASILQGLSKPQHERLVTSESGFANHIAVFLEEHYSDHVSPHLVDTIADKQMNATFLVYEFVSSP